MATTIKSKKKTIKKVISDVKLKKIAERCQNLSIEELKQRIIPRSVKLGYNKPPSLEQQIFILKLLQLNGMSYSVTSRMVKVSRNSLKKWADDWGHLVFTAKPDIVVAEKIETDLAVIQGETLKKAYRMINTGLDRLQELSASATGMRAIYAIAEAIRATTEVLKIEKELSDAGKVPGSDFFMNIHNMMIQNTYGDGNKD